MSTYTFPEGTITRDENGQVTHVKLPLSRDEWMAMGVRDDEKSWPESMYIGPCCGNTGRAQDIFCAWLRMNSATGLSAYEIRRELSDLHVQLRNHDQWNDRDMPDLAEHAEKDPWARLLLLYETVRDDLPEGRDVPHAANYDETDPEKALSQLGRRGEVLSFKAMFDRDREPSHMTKARRLEQVRRILPLIHTVYHHVQKMAPETIEGWAVVIEGTDELAEATGGPAIFETEAEASAVAAKWTTQYAEDVERARQRQETRRAKGWDVEEVREHLLRRFVVRPCRVSLEEGVVLLPSEEG